MRCFRCWTDNPEDAVYCFRCGRKLPQSRRLVTSIIVITLTAVIIYGGFYIGGRINPNEERKAMVPTTTSITSPTSPIPSTELTWAKEKEAADEVQRRLKAEWPSWYTPEEDPLDRYRSKSQQGTEWPSWYTPKDDPLDRYRSKSQQETEWPSWYTPEVSTEVEDSEME
ncbi:TPA: zinc ribbon domain-containing protein [Candidatus Poribacteria bacterium]|nr:zinc ribbon domain-containing protein [Candidatus Poribacteria bacterium]